jgi:acyl carrier protein
MRLVTTNKIQLEQRTKEILASVLLFDEAQFTPDAALEDDLGMDSLDRIEIVMKLEEELLPAGTGIDEEEADAWKTVGQVFATVQKVAHQ